MYVTDIVRLNKKKSKIVCDEAVFALYIGEVRRLGIEVGTCISEELCYEIFNEILYKRAKERALHLIEAMDRTEYQIRQKLSEGYYPAKVIERVIAFLIKYNYIDDKQYAKKYMEYSMSSKSMRRISEDLLKKGIKKDILDNLLISNEEDEKEQIIKILEKKKYNEVSGNLKEKNKIIAYLLRRGYGYDLILASINQFTKS